MSAAILPGPPRRVILAWHKDRFEMIVSLHLLHELQTVLSRNKFRRYLTYQEVLEYVMWLRESATLAEEDEILPKTPDPDDDYLISLATNASADFIVSGDGHLLGLDDESLPKVLRRADFLAQLRSGRCRSITHAAKHS